MLSISFILSFIMASIAMIIGILAFNAFIGGIPCPTTPEGLQACEQGKSIGWTVVAIFPITLFFGLTTLFSKMGLGND